MKFEFHSNLPYSKAVKEIDGKWYVYIDQIDQLMDIIINNSDGNLLIHYNIITGDPIITVEPFSAT